MDKNVLAQGFFLFGLVEKYRKVQLYTILYVQSVWYSDIVTNTQDAYG